MDWAENYEHGMDNGGAAPGSRPFYDTHAGVRRLTKAGIEEPHAEAIVNEQLHASGQSASKADILAIRQELRSDIERQGQELRSDIERQGQELRTEIKDVKASIVMWGAGYSLAITTLVVTLLKLP